MRIAVLCSDARHPVYPRLERWCAALAGQHDAALFTQGAELPGGDLLLLVSCSELLDAEVRGKYGKTLVLHASDLPRGRGWSPHVWQILEGCNRFVVTLFEARDAVDSGPIWGQRPVVLEGHELFDEINARLFDAQIALMDFAVEQFGRVEPRAQDAGAKPTFHPRRTPQDSRLDPAKSIAEQFDLLRVCDPRRFPAFFEYRGHRYVVSIRKADGGDA